MDESSSTTTARATEEKAPVFIPRRLSITDDCVMLIKDDGNMEEISEVIPREFLNCRLCNEEFQEPKLLPCLHSFCRKCLASYVLAQQAVALRQHPEDEAKFSCPECGTEVNAEDAEFLPDNVLARRLSCPLLTSPSRETAICASCGQQGRGEVPATVHCANCEENLCASCARVHNLQVETASHKVEPLKSLVSDGRSCKESQNEVVKNSQSPAESVPAVLSQCCQCYDAYDIDCLYCVDCDQGLCADCHAARHQGHRCAELSAVAQNFTSKIQEPVEDLRRDSQTLNKMLASLDRSERHANKLMRDTLSRVRRRTRMLCGLLRDYESALLQEIERHNQRNMDVIQGRRLAASQRAASISAVTELTDKLLQFGSEEEKVVLRRKVGRRVRELCETELPSQPLELTHLSLQEPSVTMETICNLFGELRAETLQPGVRRRTLMTSQSSDSLRTNLSESTEENISELKDLEEEEELGEAGGKIFSKSDRADVFTAERRKAQQQTYSEETRRRRHSHTGVPKDLSYKSSQVKAGDGWGWKLKSLETEKWPEPSTKATTGGDETADTSNSSFQSSSSTQDNIPTQLLETPHKELELPEQIARDNIKGVGVNSQGDIIIATIATASGGGKSTIYVLEQHGIVRGQIPVAPNWTLHCVAQDGKVVLIIPRGDNRFKVKVMAEDGKGSVLADVHLESFGLNFVTATSSSCLLVTSNRYAQLSSHGGKAAKSGGNIAFYDADGRLDKRLTNEDLAPKGSPLLEKPHWLAVDGENNIFVADGATHCVCGFSGTGKLLFRLGNSDMEMEDLYQGPDSVCVDKLGHVIVTDKKEGRIDVLNYDGQLLKSLFPSDPIKFVCTTPDKLLLVVPTEGNLKFYHYL